jgi:transmembrane sensor
MDHDIDLAALGRYFAGECSEGERRELERWIEDDPARQAFVARLRAAWDSAAEPLPAVDVEGAWEAVVRRKTARSASPEPRRLFVHLGGAGRPRRWLGVAAAAALVVGSSTALWLAHQAGQQARPVAGLLRTAATGPGQSAHVYLADGTHVRLGASTTLSFPATFGPSRDVRLEGEAYFDVVHDPSRPFAVHTARAVARDLGTRFNVRAYRESTATEVVVAEGAVALAAGGDTVLLTRADLGRLDAAGRLSRTRGVDVDARLAWMDGRLVFVDTPLREALPQLSRWYGVDFTAADPALADTRLTTTLQVASLPEALRRLSAVLDARVERRGGAVVLHPNRRAR